MFSFFKDCLFSLNAFLLLIIIFFTLNNLICCFNLPIFLFVDNKSTWNVLLFSLITFNVVIPIDPVEPKIAIFFFIFFNVQ